MHGGLGIAKGVKAFAGAAVVGTTSTLGTMTNAWASSLLTLTGDNQFIQEFVYVLAWEQNGQKCDLEKAQSIKNTIERIIKVKK